MANTWLTTLDHPIFFNVKPKAFWYGFSEIWWLQKIHPKKVLVTAVHELHLEDSNTRKRRSSITQSETKIFDQTQCRQLRPRGRWQVWFISHVLLQTSGAVLQNLCWEVNSFANIRCCQCTIQTCDESSSDLTCFVPTHITFLPASQRFARRNAESTGRPRQRAVLFPQHLWPRWFIHVF